MYLKMLFAGTGIVGLGVVLYNNTVPTEEEVVAVSPVPSLLPFLVPQFFKFYCFIY
jgi:hypothetical protein